LPRLAKTSLCKNVIPALGYTLGYTLLALPRLAKKSIPLPL